MIHLLHLFTVLYRAEPYKSVPTYKSDLPIIYDLNKMSPFRHSLVSRLHIALPWILITIEEIPYSKLKNKLFYQSFLSFLFIFESRNTTYISKTTSSFSIRKWYFQFVFKIWTYHFRKEYRHTQYYVLRGKCLRGIQ